MTTTTPLPGNTLGLTTLPRDTSREAVQARIEQYCAWFNLEVPKIRKSGRSFAGQDLIDWCIQEFASIDWIFSGNVKSMALLGRTFWQLQREHEAEELATREAEAAKKIGENSEPA